MIRIVIGCALLAASLAVLAAAAWVLWRAGGGRHRKPRRIPAVTLLAAPTVPDGVPYGTEAVLVEVPPAPSVLPLRPEAEDREEDGRADPDTVALLADLDRADFAHCLAEGRRTAHFFHSDGTRTCCSCEPTTAGDQT